MGLSSSQARLLTLTARQHSIEYAAQRLEAQKLQLANDSDQVYNDYMKKLDATKIQYKIIQPDGSIYYDNATFEKLAKNKFLFNVDGKIFTELGSATKDANGKFPEGTVRRALQDKGIEITASDSYTLLTSLVSEGLVVLMEESYDKESGYEYKEQDGSVQIVYTNPSTNEIEAKGMSADEVYKVFKNTSVATSTMIQEITDDKELRKAEAEYEANMNRINAKDARYDTELSQLETERNAIKNEIDTLKTVAKDNVERTFKLFT